MEMQREIIEGLGWEYYSVIEASETPFDSLEELDYSNYRVLLVEDNELNAEIAEAIIGTTGIGIDHVLKS